MGDEEERDETPVTLPAWIVKYLVENAYGQFTVAEAVLSGSHGAYELEAAWQVLCALREARVA